MKKTIIEQISTIKDYIYQVPYDELTDYLKGIRDMINLLNGEEQAEENDRDFVNEKNGYSKDDIDAYEIGGCLSVYKKLGESDYYYREL